MARPGKSVRRRRRKKKTGRGCAWFAFILLIILTAVIFLAWRWATGRLTEEAGLFMERVAAGEKEGAAALLEGEAAGLDQWIEFFAQQGTIYHGIDGGRLTFPAGGRVDVNFQVEDRQFVVPLLLAFHDRAWRVQAVPLIETVPGAFVRSESGRRLRLLWQGRELNTVTAAPTGLQFGDVVKVMLVGDTAVTVEPLERVALSRLLLRGNTVLEGEREGLFPVSESMAVYLNKNDQVKTGSRGDLLIGSTGISLYLDDGQVAAVRMNGEHAPDTIRVVLRRNLANLTGETLRHRWLNLTGEAPYTLEDKIAGARYTYAAGEALVVEPVQDGIRVTAADGTVLHFQNRIFLESPEQGRLVVLELPRSGWENASPAYRGVLEITNQGGQLVVVNEIGLEQYLYTVVPSEMPLSFGLEPLKVQAVAARSYACTSIFSGSFGGYGAHVDDSVQSQVYNNIPEYPLSREAVDATAGEVLYHGASVADTRFFSTSCGSTADFSEVWHDPASGRFPSENVPYLKAAGQIPGETVRLDSEAAVRQFLWQADWPQAYDQESPYFRWQVEMTAAELEAAVNRNLGERFAAQPDFILTRDGDTFRSIEIPRNPLGRLHDIRVIERGAGGNIMVLELEGTNGTYRIIKEYNIRFTLRPVQYLPGGAPVVLRRYDGSMIDNYSILPSAFACFDLDQDADGYLERVVIFGGGNGHGVGMSQYGARGMAALGRSYREILQHYYPGTDLQHIY